MLLPSGSSSSIHNSRSNSIDSNTLSSSKIKSNDNILNSVYFELKRRLTFALLRFLLPVPKHLPLIILTWIALIFGWTILCQLSDTTLSSSPPYWPVSMDTLSYTSQPISYTSSSPSSKTKIIDLPLKLEDMDEFTIFMTIRNREEYLKTVPSILDSLSKCIGCPKWKFLLIDLGSSPPLTYPDPSLFTEQAAQHINQIHIIRVLNAEGFDFWQGLAAATAAVRSPILFYIDGCNWASSTFPWPNYILTSRPNHPDFKFEPYYFANPDRYFSGNMVVEKEALAEFLHTLPPRIMSNRYSFYGSDQLMIWYLNLNRAQDHLQHLTHDPGNPRYNIHNLILWRATLWLLRYGNSTWENRNYSPSYCHDKQPFCFKPLNYIVSSWGIYHVLDAVLRAEFAWSVMFAIANVLFAFKLPSAIAWPLGVVLMLYMYHWMVLLAVSKFARTSLWKTTAPYLFLHSTITPNVSPSSLLSNLAGYSTLTNYNYDEYSHAGSSAYSTASSSSTSFTSTTASHSSPAIPTTSYLHLASSASPSSSSSSSAATSSHQFSAHSQPIHNRKPLTVDKIA